MAALRYDLKSCEWCIKANNADPAGPGSVRNRHCSVEVETAAQIGVGQSDRIGLRRRDDVGSGERSCASSPAEELRGGQGNARLTLIGQRNPRGFRSVSRAPSRRG